MIWEVAFTTETHRKFKSSTDDLAGTPVAVGFAVSAPTCSWFRDFGGLQSWALSIRGLLTADWSKDSFAPVPSFVDTGSSLVDKSNVESFIQAKQSMTK